MEFDSVIKKRKSAQAFTAKKPSWKAILDAIDSAIQNPFAGNHNNLKFLIIEDSKTINKIANLAEQTWISESSTLVLICSNETHLENIYGERGRIYSRQQAGAAIQTLLLKLVDLGLSACWVGAYSDKDIKHLLSIPNKIQIEAIIPIGYENKAVKIEKKKKEHLEKVIYWESWFNDKRPPLFKEPKDEFALKY